jgi:hypothetical protein
MAILAVLSAPIPRIPESSFVAIQSTVKNRQVADLEWDFGRVEVTDFARK